MNIEELIYGLALNSWIFIAYFYLNWKDNQKEDQ